MRKIVLVGFSILGLFLLGCSETLSPGSDGTFIRGRVEDAFTQDPAVNLGIGLEYLMEAAKPKPRIGTRLASAQGTVEPPAPNPTQDTTKLRVVLTQAIPNHVLIVESASRQRPGVLSEWKDLSVGTNEITWNLRDKFTGEFLPNGLYFVRLLDADLEVVSETRLFINRRAREASILQAFSTFTDGNGDFLLEDVVVGEPFISTDATGKILGTVKPISRVVLYHDDLEFRYEELDVLISPNQGVRFDFTVESVARGPQLTQEREIP